MSEWIDVPVADVQTGDEVKVDGYGKPVPAGEAYSFSGLEYYSVVRITLRDVVIDWMQGKGVEPKHVHIRRSSIVAVRRRKTEPSPKPGDWRHGAPCSNAGLLMGHIDLGERESCSCPQVFRASGGWSRDTRTGQPWVMQNGDPVEVVIPARIADISGPLRNADDTYMRVQKSVDESWADYYKRIGLDVRPADRRGKR